MRTGIAVERRAQPLHQRRPRPGIRADQGGAEMIAHRRRQPAECIPRHGRRGRRLAPAYRAICCLDAHQDVVRMGHRLGRHADGLEERQRHRDRIDAADDERRAVERGGKIREGHSPRFSFDRELAVAAGTVNMTKFLVILDGSWRS